MPQLGETVAEGTITQWFKAVGDKVAPGENLFEIETDKATMEVPATAAGELKEIRVPKGAVVPVGAIVAIIADGSGAATMSSVATSAPTPRAPSVAPSAPAPAAARPIQLEPFREVRTPERNFGPARLAGGIVVTPLARRLAGEASIDLARITGSGPHGRIVARDIEQATRAKARPALEPGTEQIKALYAERPFDEVPLDNMRRTIARRLTEAVQTIPHFYLTADVDIERLLALRAEANAAAPTDKDGTPAFRLSLNDFIVKALALALQRVPAANAAWAGDRILRFKHSDVGVAVALDGGLITPVIRAAETKSLAAISAEARELATRARDRKLQPGEYQGGSTAVSNLGMYGVREFTAIINPPHATILAVGAAQRRPVETADGGVKFVDQMTVTLGCDHRVVDGALGAELFAAFKALIERPVAMLV
ncbi:MAG: 2-oxo acid dehydrogenase subunit E2 [Bradyrhizobiaceae bacterium]|nr:2-oxo acid dehydrogenase subunit E2 [Hyphomicrobiales bacterium]MBV9429048.1 2-oxo acid dehydrogenase subunit E2 [Bradyrhizobiaceae bacterium]